MAELIGQIGNGVWIASSEKIYYKYLNKKGREGKCIGVCLNKGYWSFNPQRMSELIADELCVEAISPKSIGQELKYYSLAHIDNERKISCRWHSEKRMYHVRVKELVKLIYPEQNIAIEVERRVNECLDF